jgi:hypothetical protein
MLNLIRFLFDNIKMITNNELDTIDSMIDFGFKKLAILINFT